MCFDKLNGKALRPSPGASRHPLPVGEGQLSGYPSPTGKQGGAKRRVRVEVATQLRPSPNPLPVGEGFIDNDNSQSSAPYLMSHFPTSAPSAAPDSPRLHQIFRRVSTYSHPASLQTPRTHSFPRDRNPIHQHSRPRDKVKALERKRHRSRSLSHHHRLDLVVIAGCGDSIGSGKFCPPPRPSGYSCLSFLTHVRSSTARISSTHPPNGVPYHA